MAPVEENVISASERETVIRRIIQVIHSSLDIDDVFQQLVNHLGGYLKADRCFIARYDSNLKQLYPPTREYRSSTEIKSMLNANPSLWEALEGAAQSICRETGPLDSGQPNQGLSSAAQAALGHIRVQSSLGCAIAYQPRCLAILFIHQVDNQRVWTPVEKEIVQVVADQAAIAIHQADMTQALKTRIHRQELIAELTRMALSENSLDNLFQETVQLVTEALELRYCKIIEQVAETTGYQLYFRAVAGYDPALRGQKFDPGKEPHAAYTLQTLEPVVVDDLYQETRFQPSPLHHEYKLVSGVSVVIYGERKAFGVLEADTTHKRHFNQTDIGFLQSIANLLGIVIERKEVEAALHKVEQRYEVTFRRAGSGIAQVGKSGEWLHLNERYCDLLGYSAEELKNLTFQELTYPDDLPRVLDLFTKLLNGEIDHYTIEKRYVRKDKTLVWTNLTCSAVWDEQGQFDYAIKIAEDITDRKRIERQLDIYARQLEQSNKDLEQFAAVASHDLQAPLRKIKTLCGMVQARIKDQLDADTLHLMDRVDRSVTEMQTLVVDVLEWSRLVGEEPVLHPVSLSSVMGKVLRNLEEPIREKGAQVQIGNLATLTGDEGQLAHLMQNLLENALKYQPPGQNPIIQIESECLEGLFCRIIVQDNGIGFRQEYAERIFNPFERLHGKSSPYQGTGVGLAICRRIVERQGGTIEAHSEEGKGSRFIVTFPVKPAL